VLKKLLQSIYYSVYGVRKNVSYGEEFHLGFGSTVWAPNQLNIGNRVYIGKYCTIEVDGSIGNDVMIANNVGLIGKYDHDFSVVGTTLRKTPWIGDLNYTGKGKNLKIIIGDDVWIGFGAIILSGVKIDRGAIVAAGAIVTRDVTSYSIVAGNPAKVIGNRFNEKQIKEHELRTVE